MADHGASEQWEEIPLDARDVLSRVVSIQRLLRGGSLKRTVFERSRGVYEEGRSNMGYL